MVKYNINYSKKNIPISSKREYKIQLISKIEKFINPMRRKALAFLEKIEND